MRNIVIACLILFASTAVQAEIFPFFKFEDVRGKVVFLGEKAKKANVIVLSKPGRGSRKANEAWMKALLPELGDKEDIDLVMIADFAGLPGFLDKDKLRQKMLSKADRDGRAVLETMLFDWHGEARPKLAKDSQIYVYVVDADGRIAKKVVGFVKPERVTSIVKAVEKL